MMDYFYIYRAVACMLLLIIRERFDELSGWRKTKIKVRSYVNGIIFINPMSSIFFRNQIKQKFFDFTVICHSIGSFIEQLPLHVCLCGKSIYGFRFGISTINIVINSYNILIYSKFLIIYSIN